MACCTEDRTVVMHVMEFMREELLYDIKNVAYVTGDTLKTDDEHDRHQVIDVGEDGNVDRVTRMMNLAFAEVVEWLSRYTKLEVGKNGKRCQMVGGCCSGGTAAYVQPVAGEGMAGCGCTEHTMGYQDNEFEEPDEYYVMMRVPGSTSLTTLRLLKELIHEYVVERVLEDWFSITAKEEQGVWREKLEETKEKILHYRNMGKKVRVRSHPW